MIYIIKEELEETVKEFFDRIKQQKRLEVQDLRYLCEQGIPAMEIMVHNIPMDCFKKGVEKWLDGLGK